MKSLELILENPTTALENAQAACGAMPETVSGKIDYAAQMLSYFESQSMRLKKDVDALARQKKEYDLLYDKLKSFVQTEMYDESVAEMSGSQFKFTLGQSQGSLKIHDKSLVPEELKVTTTSVEPDNARIKAMLVLGHEIPGCELVQGFKLTVRNTKED